MGCQTCGSTKTYTNDGNYVHNRNTCCSATSSCQAPETYDPTKIVAECIFVEKVYDSVILKKEVDAAPSPIITTPITTIPLPAEIESINITCSARNVDVTPIVTRINGTELTPFPTVPGPGGLGQIDLSFIDTSKCDHHGDHHGDHDKACNHHKKGTQILIAQTLALSGTIDLNITGRARRFVTGDIQPFSTKATLYINTTPPPGAVGTRVDIAPINAFASLCIPSTEFAMKPSLAEFCSVLCNFILPNGLENVTINPGAPGTVTLTLSEAFLVLCLTCEKKVKVPVQLCVLSTGFCEPPEQAGLCVEFPKLFPDQIFPTSLD